MKLSVLFATLLATAMIAVAAPPQGHRGPVEGRGMRQGPPPWAQAHRAGRMDVAKLPADVQPLAAQIQEKMKEIQALRAQIREKMSEQKGEVITGRGPWAHRGMEKAGERPYHQGKAPMMHRERVRGEKKVEVEK